MAAYTTETRLGHAVGTAYLTAATSKSTTPLTTLIASASDVVAGYLRNNGYTPPSDADLTAIDQTVVLATEALVIQALANIPENSMPLPDGWSDGMQVIALKGILNGDVVLSLTLSNISAVGGSKFSDSDPDLPVSEGGRPQRASRKELASY